MQLLGSLLPFGLHNESNPRVGFLQWMSKIADPDFARGLEEFYALLHSCLPVCTGGFEPRVGLPHEVCRMSKKKSGCGSAILSGRLLGKFEVLLTTIYTVYRRRTVFRVLDRRP